MSRTIRTPKTISPAASAQTSGSPDQAPPPPPQSPHCTSSTAAKTNHRVATTAAHIDDGFPEHRAAKRRKLEIRGPRQQTLDSFFNSNPIRPPIKIAASQPNGQLIETVRGVQRELPVNVDDLLDSNGTDAAQRASAPPAAKKLKTTTTSTATTTITTTTTTTATTTTHTFKQEEKRALRSHDDGPRLKSDLATYFNNYEDIIFDAPRELELLNVESTIYIVDDAPPKSGKVTPSPTKNVKPTKDAPPSVRHGSFSTAQGSRPPLAPQLDLSVVSRSLPDEPDDPLTDAAFLVSHRRAERKEKQMRNIEREHAMHEKWQLEKLLDGLLGHDWLRVLGITGITESEARKFEPKRDYFVEEVRTLVNKFNTWKEEEKRQKTEREAMLAAEREAEFADDDYGSGETSTVVSSIEPPSSDLNLSASRQLQQETAIAIKSLAVAKTKRRDRPPQSSLPAPPIIPYRAPSPIVSFYPSRHLRESALKKARNSRNVTAFGLPLPEVEECDFALPSDYLTEDVLRASARERRRKNRESVANAAMKSG